ncbi:MAG: hypothetical protein JWM76_3282 [Pseudonocardiales bacterium]|nr:hypothetical protein [Pseudonocardiales bacterium]
MEIWELIARESARDLITRYNGHGDSGRMDQLIEVFAPDAVLDLEGDLYEGREAIRAAFVAAGRDFVAWAKEVKAPRDVPVIRHYTSTTVIEVQSPTEASAVSWFLVLMHQGLDHWGSYHDEFREIDGVWYIWRRRVVMGGATAGSNGAREMARLGRGGF